MEKYKITFKKSVTKDLRSIPNKDIKRILLKIESLSEDPRCEGCTKLTSHDNYRVRQGIYRIIYSIKDTALVINIIKVSHRSNVYKNT